MLKILALSLLAAVASYLVAAFGGGLLVAVLSNNPHDRGVEAAMTGAFVFGPLAAVLGFVFAFGVLRARRSRGASAALRQPSDTDSSAHP